MEQLSYSHDTFFKSLLDNKDYCFDFLSQLLPSDVLKSINLKKIKRVSTTFINEDLKSNYADCVFEIPFKDKSKGYLSLLIEHKSQPQRYAAIQLLFYVASGYFQQVFRNKQKPQIIIPVIYYQGKQKWKYLSIEELFENLPKELKIFIPVFRTVFIDLNNYTDEEIESWKSDVLSISTIIQKHAFDKEFLESRIYDICKKIDNLDDRNLILSIFVYFINQSDIKEEKITKIVKELKNKKDIMSTLQLIEKRGEAKGEAKEKEQTIIKGYQKGYELSVLSDITELSIKKIKDILKKNGLM